MIDIHSHILPGVDDGAQTIEQSIEMAKAAVNDGITKIVASPHHQTSKYYNEKSIVVEKVQELNEVLQAEGIPLEVLTGQEVRLFGEWVIEYENNQIATVNEKNYCLIEFPANHVPSYAERLFYDIQMKGITPIIVHPERNSQIVEQPDKLFQLIDKGAISQVTASSLTGDFGKKIQKFSLQLFEANLAHVIASDAHNITTRRFKLADSYEIIGDHFGTEMVYMLKENAELIIEGKMIYREHPEKIKKKRLLGIF
ncbi:tyrosine protein phosphatase [Caldibacillus lycopersici]|uniref:Tyrosine-protein phosphatase n=1 Tax=Perspicuibacillus lycopersici TaxID=1325689 RepID=A0AAE3IUQ0_9BACI|nr:CpsB/CapC family capsule biosynthesis tyrosine phosphatase [Perspicuibacillus lycopersici]MCU9613199.1 tyrosine protein phosphatase [Perspicuibacillus lycopersici]